MPIPEIQLDTWSRQGAITTARTTHETIRRALRDYSGWPDDVSFDDYLQGSYRNDTNIRSDSDVDIVAELTSSFRSDRSGLTVYEQGLQLSSYSSSSYGWDEFRADVLRALRNRFGTRAVQEGEKAVTVLGESGRLSADVLVCIEHHKYRSFTSLTNQDFSRSVTFYVLGESRWVVNYPRQHYDNGVSKHQASGQWFKPTVRIFKNARTYLIDRRRISSDLAPSYFLQCLLYNVPNQAFGPTYQQTYWDVLNWLSSINLDGFICQNGEVPLFGSTPEQWTTSSARQLIQALEDLWDNW